MLVSDNTRSWFLITMTSLLLAAVASVAWTSNATTTPEAAGQKAKIEAGEAIYDDYCSTCHGVQLQNNTGVSFDLRRLRADAHDRFVNSVLKGKNAMPAWQGALTKDQIEAIWVYVRAHAYQ